MIISRSWAMPLRHTFTMRPVAELLQRYIMEASQWFDPFAGEHSPVPFENRNDLNPAAPTAYHLDAQAFLESLSVIPNLLLDPPYSPRQISECYRSIGLAVGRRDTQNGTLYKRVKDAAAERIPEGGCVICCGWNSQGFGRGRGFELEELLLVAHGGAHNDTIVTVERRV